MNKIEVKNDGRGNVKIYIDSLLHLSLYQDSILAIQSWKERDDWYCIEYTLKGGVEIMTAYDKIERWKQILKQLNDF